MPAENYEGLYESAQLEVYETLSDNTDSEQIRTLEYKNQQGQLVAKGIRINDSLERFTYFVYDDFNNLRFTIPYIEDRKIVKDVRLRTYAPHELRYSIYHGYDKNGDKIVVCNPDQAPVNSVFDGKHREILRQDGNQKKRHQWTYTEYDEYDRVLRTSLVYADIDASAMRARFEGYYGEGAKKVADMTFTGKRLLIQIQYDGYDEPISTFKGIPVINAVETNNMTSTVIPEINIQDVEKDPYIRFKIPSYLKLNAILGVYPSLTSSRNPGAKIYEKIAILSSDTDDSLSYVEKAYYYDNKGRIIQSVVRNHMGGITRITNKYDFRGNVLIEHESKQVSENALSDIRKVCITYDKFGRKLSESMTLNDSPSANVVYHYDELGRNVGTVYGDSIICNQFTYDISGKVTSQNNKVFHMNLKYEEPVNGAEPHYNGMVSECTWRSGDKFLPMHTYAYNYSPFGQFENVEHFYASRHRPEYEESGITYDENDNILTLTRHEEGYDKTTTLAC